MAFAPDGQRLVIGDYESVCHLIGFNGNPTCVLEYGLHRNVEQGLHIEWIEFSRSGGLVASTNEGLTAVWESDSGKTVGGWEGCSFGRFAPKEMSLLVTDRKVCVNWEFTTGRTVSYVGHGASIAAADWSPSGELAVSGDWKGNIHVWDPRSGHLVALLTPGDQIPVVDLVWVDGGILVLLGNGTIWSCAWHEGT